MKILIPILGFGPQGGYRVLSKLADAWLDLGHEVTFLVPSTSPPPYFPTRAPIVAANRKGLVGKRIISGAAGRERNGADNILSVYAGLKAIGTDFDVILANHCLTAWPLRLARCGAALKVYYIQAYEPAYYSIRTDPIKHLLARFSYHLGLKHISNSKMYPIAPGEQGIRFIPPGVDVDVFHSERGRQPLIGSHPIYLGTIGRTEPYKGTASVLSAFETLHRFDERFRLKVAFGNLPPDWSHPAVEIVDIKNDDELADFYRSLDILLVGAVGQTGAPHYPVIEGMACRTPVLHTGYFPGNSENSWLAEPGDPQALVDGVLEILADETVEAKTTMGLNFVRDNLSWPALASSMSTYFQD